MKTVIKALLAATALLPVAAYAQDANWQGRGNRGEARADRPDGQRNAGQRYEGQRGQWRGRADAQVQAQRQTQPQPQPQPQTQPPRVDAQAQAEMRAPQQDYRRDRQGDPGRNDRAREYQRRGDQNRVDRAQAYQRQVDQAPAYQNRRDDRARYDNGAAAVQRYQNDRYRNGGRDLASGRQDWRDDRRDNRQYGNRDDARGVRNRGNWSRDWRSDNRYNYNQYRSYNRSAYRLPRYYAPSGWGYGYRRFSIGVTLSSFLWDQNYWIDDPYAYRLPEAYGPYRWVRYYNDALLIDIRNGRVVDSVYGIFY